MGLKFQGVQTLGSGCRVKPLHQRQSRLTCSPGSSRIPGWEHAPQVPGPHTPKSVKGTTWPGKWAGCGARLEGHLSTRVFPPSPLFSLPNCRANPVWLDPFCQNLELATQAEHEDDLPENLSEIADLWNSPTRTHVSQRRSGITRGRSGGAGSL